MDKGKKVLSSSKYSKEYSESDTSHDQPNDAKSHVLSEIHPQGSNQPLIAKFQSTYKSKKMTSGEKGQTASHSKYGFYLLWQFLNSFNYVLWMDILFYFGQHGYICIFG
jgi:hypothetical protein